MQVLSQMFTKHISKVLVLIQEKMYAVLFAHYTHTRHLIIIIIIIIIIIKIVVRMGALMALWSRFYYSVVYRLHSDIVSMVYCLYPVKAQYLSSELFKALISTYV